MEPKIKYLSLLLVVLLARCAKEEVHPIFEVPVWEPATESFVQQPPVWNSVGGITFNTSPEWILDLKENDAIPDWQAPDQHLYPGSMTAIIRLTPYLEKHLALNDKMAAMIGDKCHGVAQPMVIDGVNYFYIQIKAASDEQGDVIFKYYSNKNNKLYTSAEKVPYRIDKIYGTSQAPAYPDFESSGRYPVFMNVFLQPDMQTIPFEVQPGDMIAAFVGNECRGSVTLNSINYNNKIFNIEIRGKETGESVTLKYYSNAKKMIYQLDEQFKIAHKAQTGTETSPVQFGLIPEKGIVAYVLIPDILSSYTSDNDIVAAFTGDECRGVFSNRFPVNGRNVYRIPVIINQNKKVEFRYFNSKLKYIFSTGNNISLSETSTFGSLNMPEELPLITYGYHPLRMKAVFKINYNSLKPINDDDKLAAFVNEECRGKGKFIERNGKKIVELDINGSLVTKEKVSIRYYNASLKYQYESVKTFDFVPGGSFGSIEAPELVELKIKGKK